MALFPASTDEYWWRCVDFPLIPKYFGGWRGESVRDEDERFRTPPWAQTLWAYLDISSPGEDAMCQRGLFHEGGGVGADGRGRRTRRNGGNSLKRGTKGSFLSVIPQGGDVGVSPGGGSTSGECIWRMNENATWAL